MTPKQWFGLIVRVIGLYVLLHGLQYLLNAVDEWGYSGTHFRITANTYALYGVIYNIVGLALIRGARRWTALAYPDPSGTGEE